MKHVAWETCPSCHEAVHPVAGRCKHCRADLVVLRAEAHAAQQRARAEARAAAGTPLRVEAPRPVVAPAARPSSSTTTRRMLLAAVAVLALGVAGGVVAQR